MPSSPTDFVGRGWSFPLSIDASGRFGLVSGDHEIAESIRLILGTSPGERPMRPEFGCAVHDRVFAPANATTAAGVADDVRSALEQWEPRIDLQDVKVTFATVDLCVLHIDISYRIKGFNDRRNLVFPFYLIPDESSR